MAKHTVTYDEIIGGCEFGVTICASHGGGENKRLIMAGDYETKTFTFLVEDNHDVVFQSGLLQEAIDAYNEL